MIIPILSCEISHVSYHDDNIMALLALLPILLISRGRRPGPPNAHYISNRMALKRARVCAATLDNGP